MILLNIKLKLPVDGSNVFWLNYSFKCLYQKRKMNRPNCAFEAFRMIRMLVECIALLNKNYLNMFNIKLDKWKGLNAVHCITLLYL